MKNISNYTNLLIGKNAATNPTAGTVASPSTLADGAIALTTVDGVILSSTTADDVASTDEVMFVQGQGSTKPLIKSAPFTRASILTAKAKKSVKAVQQISYVGYNGTSGNLVLPSAGTNVLIRNTFKSNFYQYSDKLMSSIVGKKITSTDTIFTVVDKLAKDCILDIQKYVNIPYKVERLFDGTKTAATSATSGTSRSIFVVASGTTAPTASVTNGSSAVTFTTASNISSVNFAVGDYIELSGVTYKIATLGTTGSTTYSITLDTAYQGSTNTSIAATAIKFWNGTPDYAKVGIRFTGLPQKKFGVNTFRYEVSKFVTTTNGFDSTTNVQSAATVGTEGSGTYEQIAQDEFFLQAFDGMHDGVWLQVPPVTLRSNVSTTGKYAQIIIEAKTKTGTMDLVTQPEARKQIIIAVDAGTDTLLANNIATSTELDYISQVVDAFIGGTTMNTYLSSTDKA